MVVMMMSILMVMINMIMIINIIIMILTSGKGWRGTASPPPPAPPLKPDIELSLLSKSNSVSTPESPATTSISLCFHFDLSYLSLSLMQSTTLWSLFGHFQTSPDSLSLCYFASQDNPPCCRNTFPFNLASTSDAWKHLDPTFTSISSERFLYNPGAYFQSPYLKQLEICCQIFKWKSPQKRKEVFH